MTQRIFWGKVNWINSYFEDVINAKLKLKLQENLKIMYLMRHSTISAKKVIFKNFFSQQLLYKIN